MQHRTHGGLAAALAILCGTASVWAQGEPVFYRGLPHLPLGNATTSTAGCSDCLIISNIGSSGDDGVWIDPGDAADDLQVTVDIGPSGALPTGMVFAIDMIAAAPPVNVGGGGPAVPPMSLTLSETNGGEAALGADFGFHGPSGVRVEAYLNEAIVVCVTLAPPYPPTLLTGDLGTVGADGYMTIDSGHAIATAPDSGPYLTIKMKRVIITSVSSGTPVGPIVADEIRVIMTGLAPGTTRPSIDAVELRAANTRQFSLHDERLVEFGNPHLALGQAQMQAGEDLVISNIGASGDDGASADVDKAGRVAVRFPNIPTGETVALNFAKIGAEQGNAARAIASGVTLSGVPGGGALSMDVDFSDLGSSSQRVDALLGGTVIGSIAGQTGSTGETTDNPECIIWDIKDSCEVAEGEMNVELHMTWPAATVMTINGLGSLSADELRVVPETPAVAGGTAGGDPDVPIVVGRVYNFSITAANTGPLTIADEDVTPLPPCPSDTDDNDVVNVVDLLGLLGAWGTADPTFDIAPAVPDGTVDVVDLLQLLADWGPCPID